MFFEAREGWGWCCFAAKLGKMKVFFDSTVGKGTTSVVLHQPSGVPSSSGKEAEFGVGKVATHLGGKGLLWLGQSCRMLLVVLSSSRRGRFSH